MPASDLFLLPGAQRRDPAVASWFAKKDELRAFALPWFERMCSCGDDVREILHDGMPTACVGEVAFAYINAFKAHVNVGFFHGASLKDPHKLLEGSGKRMRHVKLKWGEPVDETALNALIAAAYADLRARL